MSLFAVPLGVEFHTLVCGLPITKNIIDAKVHLIFATLIQYKSQEIALQIKKNIIFKYI